MGVKSLAAITDYALLAALADTGLSKTAFGYSMFLKPTTDLGNGSATAVDWLGCFLNRTIHPSTQGTGFVLEPGNSRWVVYTDYATGYGLLSFAANSDVVLPADEWSHLMAWITITPNTTTRTIKVWANGVPMVVTTTSMGTVPETPSDWNQCRIGNRGAGTNAFAGSVAEFMLLGDEPTDEEAEKIGLLGLAPSLVIPDKTVYYNPLRDTADLTAPLIGAGVITLAGNAAMDEEEHPEITYELAPASAGGGARGRRVTLGIY